MPEHSLVQQLLRRPPPLGRLWLIPLTLAPGLLSVVLMLMALAAKPAWASSGKRDGVLQGQIIGAAAPSVTGPDYSGSTKNFSPAGVVTTGQTLTVAV